MTSPDPILIFDGICILCNRLVRFIIRNDPQGRIKFTSLQSDSGRAIMKDKIHYSADIDTVVYCRGDSSYIKSTAVLYLLRDLGGGWRLFFGFIIIPRFIRDLIYNFIAQSRYRIFGRYESCPVPESGIKERFL